MFYKTVLLLTLLPTFAFGQVKIDGPKEGVVGYRTKAKLTLDVDDPKIICFPANDDWMAIQDFSGNKYIDFVPGRKFLGKVVTFVVSGNKAGKTYLEVWEVVIRPDEDLPETDITKTDLYKSIRAAYMVNPDADAKARLTEVYRTFLDKMGTYNSNSSAYASLVVITESKMKSGELRSTRDTVAEYFKKTIGQVPNAWDKAKAVKAVTEVIAVLEAIK